jgi:hypothetical protein
MSRAVFLGLNEGQVVSRCIKEKVRVSLIERLPSGGVRLVCQSSEGAERIKAVLQAHILDERAITRQRHRPTTPLW